MTTEYNEVDITVIGILTVADEVVIPEERLILLVITEFKIDPFVTDCMLC